jgi:hypothetical protein
MVQLVVRMGQRIALQHDGRQFVHVPVVAAAAAAAATTILTGAAVVGTGLGHAGLFILDAHAGALLRLGRQLHGQLPELLPQLRHALLHVAALVVAELDLARQRLDLALGDAQRDRQLVGPLVRLGRLGLQGAHHAQRVRVGRFARLPLPLGLALATLELADPGLGARKVVRAALELAGLLHGVLLGLAGARLGLVGGHAQRLRCRLALLRRAHGAPQRRLEGLLLFGEDGSPPPQLRQHAVGLLLERGELRREVGDARVLFEQRAGRAVAVRFGARPSLLFGAQLGLCFGQD